MVLAFQDTDRLAVDEDLGAIVHLGDAEDGRPGRRELRLVQDESEGLAELFHDLRAVGVHRAAEPFALVQETCACGEFGDGRGEPGCGGGCRFLGDGRVPGDDLAEGGVFGGGVAYSSRGAS